MTLRTWAAAGVRGAGLLLHALAICAVVACALYWLTNAAGLVLDFHFPVSAIHALLPWTARLVRYEPAIGYVILLYALVGAALSWVAQSDDPAASAFRDRERRLLLLWDRAGFPFVASLFVLSLGITWRGILREGDLTYYSLAGLAPFSDAYNYFQATYIQVATGVWDTFASRRPYAAAQRSTAMFFMGYSSVAFLIAQALCLAAAVHFAVRAVMHWRGVWSGLTFLGLGVLLTHNYLPTHLTEPIGIFWAFVAVPFAIAAMRTRSRLAALACLLAMCIALFTRMGSMFTIPFVALWAVWIVRDDRRSVLRMAAAVTAVVLLCVAFNSLLLVPYGAARGGGAGGNFSYTACGLAHGGDWRTCPALYAAELDTRRGDEAAQAQLLYDRALSKVKSEPLTLVRRLAGSEMLFLVELPHRVLAGYPLEEPVHWFPTLLWYAAAIAGLVYTMRRRRAHAELSFWFVILGSILLSAPFVIHDAGWRVLSATLPFIALFLSSGFSTRGTYVPDAQVRSRSTALLKLGLIAVAMLLFLVTPAIATRLDVPDVRALSRTPITPDEVLVLARSGMSGFLVVPDSTRLPTDVPAIPLSSLRLMLARSGIAAEQQPPPFPDRPFSVVVAIEPRHYAARFLIGPPDLIQRRDAVAWKLLIDDWTPEVQRFWYPIRSATPVTSAPGAR